MIISEENPASPTKPSLSPITQTGVERRAYSPGPAPPSYAAATSPISASPASPLLPYHSNTQNIPQGHYSSMGHAASSPTGGYPYPYHHISEEEERQARRRARDRFLKAFLIGFLCYLIFTTWVSLTFDIGIDLPRIGIPGVDPKSPRPPPPPTPPNKPDSPSRPDDPSQPDDDKSYPYPGNPDDDKRGEKPWPSKWDGDIIACWGDDSWSSEPPSGVITLFNQDIILVTGPDKHEDLPYTSYRSLTLPVDASGLTLFSKGRHASGTATLRVSESDEDDGLVRVNIQASYKYPQALKWTNVCELEKDDARSIGIYTSRDYDGVKDIRFLIDVQFPKAYKTSAPLEISRFTLAFSWFDYNIATLDQVFFKDLMLVTQIDKIHSKGVIARDFTASSSNGAITGSYNVSKSGVFTTSNAKIEVDLNVFDEDETEKGPEVVLSTSNGIIKAEANLWHIVDNEPAKSGKFRLTASTKNAAVNITFPTAPVDSYLVSSVSTSNARLDVTLHPTYEGDVTLGTSNAPVNVHAEDGVEDPSGRGRQRVVTWSTVWKSWAIVWVGWGEKKKAGSLTAVTSNGAVSLSV